MDLQEMVRMGRVAKAEMEAYRARVLTALNDLLGTTDIVLNEFGAVELTKAQIEKLKEIIPTTNESAVPGDYFAGIPVWTAPVAWRDVQGDVWTLGEDGLLYTTETRPFPRAHVEKKWGPLVPLTEV